MAAPPGDAAVSRKETAMPRTRTIVSTIVVLILAACAMLLLSFHELRKDGVLYRFLVGRLRNRGVELSYEGISWSFPMQLEFSRLHLEWKDAAADTKGVFEAESVALTPFGSSIFGFHLPVRRLSVKDGSIVLGDLRLENLELAYASGTLTLWSNLSHPALQGKHSLDAGKMGERCTIRMNDASGAHVLEFEAEYSPEGWKGELRFPAPLKLRVGELYGGAEIGLEGAVVFNPAGGETTAVDPRGFKVSSVFLGEKRELTFSGSPILVSRRMVSTDGTILCCCGNRLSVKGKVTGLDTPAPSYSLIIGPGKLDIAMLYSLAPPSVKKRLGRIQPHGLVTIAGRIEGTEPSIELQCDPAGAGASFEDSSFTVEIRRGKISASLPGEVKASGVRIMAGGIPLDVDAALKRGPGGTLDFEGRIRGRKVPVEPLAILMGLPAGAGGVRGELDIDVTGKRGSDGAPVLDGYVKMRGVRLSPGGVRVKVESGRILISNEAISLENPRLFVGNSPVELRISVGKPLSARPTIEGEASIREFDLAAISWLFPIDLERGEADLFLRAEGQLLKPSLSGTLRLDGVTSARAGVENLHLEAALDGGELAISSLSAAVEGHRVSLSGMKLHRVADGFQGGPARLEVDGAPLTLSVRTWNERTSPLPLMLELRPAGTNEKEISLKAKLFRGREGKLHAILLPLPLPIEIHAERKRKRTILTLHCSDRIDVPRVGAWMEAWKGIPSLRNAADVMKRFEVRGKLQLALSLEVPPGGKKRLDGKMSLFDASCTFRLSGGGAVPVICPRAEFRIEDNSIHTTKVDVSGMGLKIETRRLEVENLLGTPLVHGEFVADIPDPEALVKRLPFFSLPEGLDLSHLPLRFVCKVEGEWNEARVTLSLMGTKGVVVWTPPAELASRMGLERGKKLSAMLRTLKLGWNGRALTVDKLILSSSFFDFRSSGRITGLSTHPRIDVRTKLRINMKRLVSMLKMQLPAGMSADGTLALSLEASGPATAPSVTASTFGGERAMLRMESLRKPLVVRDIRASWRPGGPLVCRATLRAGEAADVYCSMVVPTPGEGDARSRTKLSLKGRVNLDRLGTVLDLPAGYLFEGRAEISGRAETDASGLSAVRGMMAFPVPPRLKIKTDRGFFVVETEGCSASFSYNPKDGVFELNPLTVGLYGGLLSMTLKTSTADESPHGKFKLTTADVDLDRFLAVGSNLPDLLKGRLSLMAHGTFETLSLQGIESEGRLDIHGTGVNMHKVFELGGWSRYFPGPKKKRGWKGLLMQATMAYAASKSRKVAAAMIILDTIKRRHSFGHVTTPLRLHGGVLDAPDIRCAEDPARLNGRLRLDLSTLAMEGKVNFLLEGDGIQLAVSNIVLGGTLLQPDFIPENGLKDFFILPTESPDDAGSTQPTSTTTSEASTLPSHTSTRTESR